MLTLHAAERYFERVLKANVDKDYITNNFYHIGMLIKHAFDKAELIIEETNLEGNRNKHYLHDNIVFVSDCKGVIVTIYTINTYAETIAKYMHNIYKLREDVKVITRETDEVTILLKGYRDILNANLIRDTSSLERLAEETEALLNKLIIEKTALEVKLKYTSKALVCGRHHCTNETILEAYKSDLLKNNCLYNFESLKFKKVSEVILRSRY